MTTRSVGPEGARPRMGRAKHRLALWRRGASLCLRNALASLHDVGVDSDDGELALRSAERASGKKPRFLPEARVDRAGRDAGVARLAMAGHPGQARSDPGRARSRDRAAQWPDPALHTASS